MRTGRCVAFLNLLAALLKVAPYAIRVDRNRNDNHKILATSSSMMDETTDRPDILTTYEKLLCRLYTTNLFNPKNEGLETMESLHEALGCPTDRSDVQIIHIAGSNGKGSTALKIAHTLRSSFEYKVGLFTSPHISSFRERIQVDQTPCSEEQVQIGLTAIFDLCDTRNIRATFFEVVTALAFKIFTQERVDVIVLETGLGGRLDPTNVIKKPVISVITSIGLEHTQILGDTVEKIALEKGGIIKRGCPVVVGKNVPVEVLRGCAMEKEASRFYECRDLLGGGEAEDVTMDYDAENSRTATAALTLFMVEADRNAGKDRDNQELLIEQIAEGVKVRPMCRFEELEIATQDTTVKVILDVAHNPQAIEYLIAKLRRCYPSFDLRFVMGMSADKDSKGCSDLLLETVSHPNRIHLVESSNPRAASVKSMLEVNPKLHECIHEETSVTLQVREALRLCAINNELLVVCGSFFIMADAREELGINEPRDSPLIGEETSKIIQRKGE